MGIFDGKTALITGAARGIGKATSLEFVRRGANVILADYNHKQTDVLSKDINDKGGNATSVFVDVRDEKSVQEMVQNCLTAHNALDFAFNNAGIMGETASLHECALSNWNNVISVNLTGVFLSMKYELSAMLERGEGAIVNTASIAGLVGYDAKLSAYSPSKHGIVGLTKTAALEYIDKAIRINAICPGEVDTPMQSEYLKKDVNLEHSLLPEIPIKRMAHPDEVAKVVTWLCSNEASYIVGHAIPVDGGVTAY